MQDVEAGAEVVSDSELCLLLQQHLNIDVKPFLSAKPELERGKKKTHAKVIPQIPCQLPLTCTGSLLGTHQHCLLD